ncbi:cupin domain-containing protein [Ancylobacter amanitiformis]|uniref:Cupin superfamily protein n=1 Tax=Ancylobacter amanitiformis TaxID=217069 RepID=A0ABU0LLT6_9HYPH|nr:cupin domain-containing protein [Ancylobacter amanitiformis]MDQ0509662.1 putative cupin superfamily protein [Ancylobacter amanitiformis]
MSFLLRFTPETLGEPEETAPPADRVVAGDPRHLTWNAETLPDGALFAGVWESSPGAWRVDYEEWEFCTLTSGVSILREDGEPPVTLKAGDSFVIRPGFKGVWEVVETTRKLYVIRLI